MSILTALTSVFTDKATNSQKVIAFVVLATLMTIAIAVWGKPTLG
jgi:hypothetical protein